MNSEIRQSITAKTLREALSLWLLLGCLLLLNRFVTSLSDKRIVLVALISSVFLLYVLFWNRRMERLAFRRAYLRKESRLFSLLSGRVLMCLGQAGLSVFFSGMLLVGMARQEQSLLLWLLIFLVPIWLTSHYFWSSFFQKHGNSPFHLQLAYHVNRYIFGICLLAGLFVLSLYQPVEDLTRKPLWEAIEIFSKDEKAQSSLLQAGVDLLVVLDAVRNWLGQNLADRLAGPLFQGALWFILLIQQWLLVWPLLLLLQATHMLTDRRSWFNQTRETGDE